VSFSKETVEQYRREIRLMWRVLGVGALVAGSVHFFSLPFISRMISGVPTEEPEITAVPIEVIVEEEPVQQTPDEPDPEPPEENPEPAASAQRPSAAPLATDAEPVPIAEVAAADTVAVAPAIATENGAIDGEGAVGDSSAIGLQAGLGEPVEAGDRINLPPNIATLIEPAPPPRGEPVPEVSLAARRRPSSRRVSCDPCSTPDYPIAAQREGIEGQPVINAIFDSSGRVIEAVVEVSSGNAAFDQAALEEAKRNWRFRDPEGLGGQVSVGVTYVMEGSQQYEEAQDAGEIRATELPMNQQVQSVTPDQPAARPSAVNEEPEAEQDEADESEAEQREVEQSGIEQDAEESNTSAPESAPSEPTPSEPVPSEPTPSDSASSDPSVPAPTEPAAVEDIPSSAPEPVAPSPAPTSPATEPVAPSLPAPSLPASDPIAPPPVSAPIAPPPASVPPTSEE